MQCHVTEDHNLNTEFCGNSYCGGRLANQTCSSKIEISCKIRFCFHLREIEITLPNLCITRDEFHYDITAFSIRGFSSTWYGGGDIVIPGIGEVGGGDFPGTGRIS
jgi:hypothetical protein